MNNVHQTSKQLEKARKLAAVRDNFELTLLAVPGILALFIFCYMPMFGVVIAFKKFIPKKGIWGSPWAGLSNFEFFFGSQDAWRVTRNTVCYSLTFMIVTLVCAVFVAILLFNLRNRAALKAYNTIMILPNFLSMVLIAFIVYAFLNPVSGMLNNVLSALGGSGNTDWYSITEAWPFILVFVNTWKSVGMNSIIYYAALMAIDDSLFEAAVLEGANKWQQTVNISIPHLIPIMTITTILAMGSIFSGDFGLFYQIPRNVGTLYPTTDIINTYTFRGLMGGSMEVSAAVGLMQSVIGLFMVVGTNLIVKKISPENSLF